MYQVGTYKNNSWALVSEFAKSGVIFDFDDSSAQAEAAKKLEKYVQDNNIRGMSGYGFFFVLFTFSTLP